MKFPLLLAAALSCFSGCPVFAYVLDLAIPGRPLRWPLERPELVHSNSFNPVTRAIRFHIASDAWSSSNRLAEIEAVRSSFDQWQSIPGTQLRFEFAGLVPPSTPLNTTDHTNLVYWTRTDKFVNGGRDDIRFSLALTYLSTTNGIIEEADIVLNGRSYRWFTDPAENDNSALFVESTMLHEVGHLIGLDHSPLGGATMFANGGEGIDAYVGLASDDIAGARALYGIETERSRFARLSGKVILEGKPVFGAIVLLEDSDGNALVANPTRFEGAYEIESIPAGLHSVRIYPLDPDDAPQFLTRGRELSFFFATNAVNTDFLPWSGASIRLEQGQTASADFEVTRGQPPPRITSLRTPAPPEAPIFLAPIAVTVRPGQSNIMVGVFSPSFPTVGGVLRVSGTGIRIGPTRLDAGGNLRGRSASIDIDPTAQPGLRTLIVDWSDGTSSSAHGFLDLQPVSRDDNFDGLPDSFQRTHFARFTAPEAAPDADPDQDGASNRSEFDAGTHPDDSSSSFKIREVELTPAGCHVRFSSVPGKRYRLLTRDRFDDRGWSVVGTSPPAQGGELTMLDPTAMDLRFYTLEVLK